MNMNQNAWAFLAKEFHDGKVHARNMLTPYEGTMRFDEDNIAVLVTRTHSLAWFDMESGFATELPVRDNHDLPAPGKVWREFRDWEEHSDEMFDFSIYGEDEHDMADEHYREWVADVYNDFKAKAELTDFIEVFLLAYSPGNDVGQYGECDLGGSWIELTEENEHLTWNEVAHRAVKTIESATLRYASNEHDDRWLAGINTRD